MKNVIFLAHWSLAFIEEQFFALYTQIKSKNLVNTVYFCEWSNKEAVNHLIFDVFHQTNELATFENFPSFDIYNEKIYKLENFTQENTVFIVQFNPQHLKHFLKATGNRFPKNYVWWQIEQESNNEFFDDSLYSTTIQKARFVIDFNCNKVDYCPFSADSQLLSYAFCDNQRLKLLQHQKNRLLYDNPRFLKNNQYKEKQCKNSVLMLGTCQVLRRKFFKKLCQNKIEIVHPREHNYVFGKEREEFIRNFIENCHANAQIAISVNIHQYDQSMLEKAKIFLLLANGCDLVISEKSIDRRDEKLMQEICGSRLKFVSNLHEMLTEICRALEFAYEPVEFSLLRDGEESIDAWLSIAEKLKTL